MNDKQETQNNIKPNFQPVQMVTELLAVLPTREVDILKLRFGLGGDTKKTLEEIGKIYKITRERVRQVEKNALNNIRTSTTFKGILGDLITFIKDDLYHHGGLRSEELVIRQILELSDEKSELSKNCVRFIIEQLLNSVVVDIIKTDHLKPSLILDSLYRKLFDSILVEVVSILEEEGLPLDIVSIKQKIRARDFYQDLEHLTSDDEGFDDNKLKRMIESYMHASQKVKINPFGAWGLKHWKSITPKRMNEKVYLVLSKQGQPTHYKKITDLVNEAGFDKKKAHPPTIHNELISDKRFVLVGRGIYALKEWGYKEGVVSDVLYEILRGAGEPMSREELVGAVLQQRVVQKNTVYIALADKGRFKRLVGGKYSIVDENN